MRQQSVPVFPADLDQFDALQRVHFRREEERLLRDLLAKVKKQTDEVGGFLVLGVASCIHSIDLNRSIFVTKLPIKKLDFLC